MKKPGTVICWLLVVAMLPVVAFAQSQKNQSESLSQFKARLKQEQERSGFLDEWNDESMDLFASIAKESGIDREDINPDKYEAWLTAYHALQDVFEQVWGDQTTWSLEQQYEYARYETEIGLSDQTVAALPTAEDLSVDEARRLVQEKLYTELAEERDASLIDLGNYHESVHFWRYPDDGGAWVFEYYGEGEKAPEYTGTLYQDTGNISIEIHDKNDLQALYQSYCALHNFKTFRWWELDEQYEFYALVVSLQQRQMEKYGELPPFATQILEHQHVMPTDQMIEPDVAMEIARSQLDPSSEQKAYITLYKDSKDRIVYEVGFDDAQTNRVFIDAFSGDVYAQ
ncbi:MAG TPA: hypothetical protein IAC11_01125 [Candidatus Limiplasma pullicola]|nr:hypothetical protein [Candidatus Limiplasma pullicola]